MEPSGHPLSGFPDIPFEYTEILRSKGIVTTTKLLEATGSVEGIARLSAETGIPDYRIRELYRLSELCRDHDVAPLQARNLYDKKL